jgi:hypothetical protein
MSLSRKLLRELAARDGHRSVWTGRDVPTLVPHHRSNRGMGGDPSKDRLSNLVWLESDINGLIESNAAWAELARLRGVKILLSADPAAERVYHAVYRCWVSLGDDGSVTALSGMTTLGARL